MSTQAPRLSTARLRGILWRKRVVRGFLRGTGLMKVLDVLSAPSRQIEVTRHHVPAPFSTPITVALIADLHLTRFGELERSMISILKTERPDLILIAGDLTALGGSDGVYRDVLCELEAPRGVWMVPGNWDYWTPMEDSRGVYGDAGIRELRNTAVEIVPGLWLAGIDDAVAGEPDADHALSNIPPEAWVLALFHCPITFETVAGRCALAFAGHTHGRHVHLLGRRENRAGADGSRYVEGWYQRNGSSLYVSRGISTPGGPVRLFGRPEVAFFSLGSGATNGS